MHFRQRFINLVGIVMDYFLILVHYVFPRSMGGDMGWLGWDWLLHTHLPRHTCTGHSPDSSHISLLASHLCSRSPLPPQPAPPSLSPPASLSPSCARISAPFHCRCWACFHRPCRLSKPCSHLCSRPIPRQVIDSRVSPAAAFRMEAVHRQVTTAAIAI
ncbi:hypothetical protein GDO78_006784 [Eleutherodactylus coqui]|uniref:Uncharacterized protein n=1 Tax=Eleutherodactylus coqui TaxID=57060 RepID=A0A8J6FE79_ELECQ|nr:hypothetical protein GDO78_006784 [Eleutherodactylus coqui]